MSLSYQTQASGGRMTWFDANRVLAALGVVVLHSSTDAAGKAFLAADPSDRVVPVLLRAMSELSGSEMFFIFSLFLFAFKLDRRRPSYGEAIGEQMKRLLIPFAFWAVFYAFFKLFKASAFGYSSAIVDRLVDPSMWVSNFVLGSSQYHMHFLPTLFALMLFYPVMRIGLRYPLFGFAVIPMLGCMEYLQGFLWGVPLDPMARDFLVRGVKVLGYVGYGIAAFSIYGLFKDGIPRGESRLLGRAAIFFVAFSFLATLPHAYEAIQTGAWSHRTSYSFYGHFLMPLGVFMIFLGRQHEHWAPSWSKLAKFTFGVYLLHPIFIDVFDVGVFALGLKLSPTATVIFKVLFVAPAALAAAYGLSRVPLLAWTIGTGPLPWLRKPVAAAPAVAVASTGKAPS